MTQIQAEPFPLQGVGGRDSGSSWWQLPSPGLSLSKVMLSGQRGWQPPSSRGASWMGSSSETNTSPLPHWESHGQSWAILCPAVNRVVGRLYYPKRSARQAQPSWGEKRQPQGTVNFLHFPVFQINHKDALDFRPCRFLGFSSRRLEGELSLISKAVCIKIGALGLIPQAGGCSHEYPNALSSHH